MQSSWALRALPVVLWLVPAPPLAAQARYRVLTDGAWFYQEAGGKRLARLARGALVSAGGGRASRGGPWAGGGGGGGGGRGGRGGRGGPATRRATGWA